MTATEALHRIAQEADEYAASRDRFRPYDTELDALRDLHVYREGVRDGRLWAGRIAREALEQNGVKMVSKSITIEESEPGTTCNCAEPLSSPIEKGSSA